MKPTIMLIIPNLGRGGAQQVFRDQLAFYSKNFKTIGCIFNWDDSFEDDRNLNIISLDVPAGRHFFGKLLCFFKRIYFLARLKSQWKIDVSISHLEGADYVNIFSRRRDKTIAWIHGSKQFDENISGFLGILRKRLFIPFFYKRSDKLVTVSRGIKEELVNYYRLKPDRISVVTNGVNTQNIVNLSTTDVAKDFSRLTSNHPVIITHCRLARQKNLSKLLEIMKCLPRTAKLVILGDGELRSDLLNQCRSLHLRAFSYWDNTQWAEDFDVFFLGHQVNSYPYLKKASLYVMPSLWEGFPLSLCEAMIVGLPAMAADCHTGPREIICPDMPLEDIVEAPVFSKYGILMPVPTSEEQVKIWAKTILEVLDNVQIRLKLSSELENRIVDFDINRAEEQWLKILSS